MMDEFKIIDQVHGNSYSRIRHECHIKNTVSHLGERGSVLCFVQLSRRTSQIETESWIRFHHRLVRGKSEEIFCAAGLPKYYERIRKKG